MAGEAARRAQNQNPRWASYPTLFAASSLSLPAKTVVGVSSASHRHFPVLDCRNPVPAKLCGWKRQAFGLGGAQREAASLGHGWWINGQKVERCHRLDTESKPIIQPVLLSRKSKNAVAHRWSLLVS